MAKFDLDPKTIDYDALPPLVRTRKELDSVVEALVEAWATPLTATPGFSECPGVTLDRVALVVGDTGEPIDLGSLLKMVARRVKGHVPEGRTAPNMAVALRGCSIPKVEARNTTLPFELRTTACRFDFVDFGSASFAGVTGFDSASFAGDAWFHSASFTGVTGFDSASFAGDAWFRSARRSRPSVTGCF